MTTPFMGEVTRAICVVAFSVLDGPHRHRALYILRRQAFRPLWWIGSFAAFGEALSDPRLVATLGGDDDAADEIAERSTPATMPVRRRTNDDVGVAVPGAPGVLCKLAKCCTPVPGDNIMGFVTRGGGVSVHRTDCTNAASLQQQAERIIDVKWAPSPSSVFLVAIQVEALDRHRLLSDVTRVLADEKVKEAYLGKKRGK